MSAPRVVVCVGGGGVGKTTTSAALALALARDGKRVLVVTIDPARRLAGAMGVPISDRVTEVPLHDAAGSLAALMPDPRLSMTTFLDYLFEKEPEAKARMLVNPLVVGLSDAAAGIHELVAMNLVAHAASEGHFDAIVIDTAPSRHAIDFVTYPGRLSALLSGRAVAWLSGIARRDAAPKTGPRSWLARATGQVAGQVEQLLARVTGPHLLRDTANLFSDLALVRERFVDLTHRASQLLLGPDVRYALVAAPTAAARDDVLFLAARLKALGRTPNAIVLNRAASSPGAWFDELRQVSPLPTEVSNVLSELAGEYAARTRAVERCVAELGAGLPAVAILRLPLIEATAPEEVVSLLSYAIEAHLPKLLPLR